MRLNGFSEEERGIREEYRRAFMEFPEVFKTMLYDLGVFSTVENEGQRVLHNYGIKLLEMIGVNTVWNHDEIARLLLNLPPDDPAEE